MNAIRPANENDLPQIMESVRSAIVGMESLGILQWDEIYPTPSPLTPSTEFTLIATCLQ